MIWHFLEVWVLMLAAFAIGCPIGALAYDLIARTGLSRTQGRVADGVGNVVDGIKTRLGIGPVWRPEYRRLIEQRAHGAPAEPEQPDLFGPDVRLLTQGPATAPRQESEWREEPWEGPETDGDGPWEENDDADEADAIRGTIWPDDGIVPKRPSALTAARNGVPDDLQRIRGIGDRNERRLNKLGIYHFGQIAAWTPAELRWVAERMAFPERIERDDWVGQAIILASGGDTGFVKAADRRRAKRQQRLEKEADALEAEGGYEDEYADFVPTNDFELAEEIVEEEAVVDLLALDEDETEAPQDVLEEDDVFNGLAEDGSGPAASEASDARPLIESPDQDDAAQAADEVAEGADELAEAAGNERRDP